MELVPRVWALTRKAQSQLWVGQSVPRMLKDVLRDWGRFSYALPDLDAREFCVQYRETDFNFAGRLMEEEGIYYCSVSPEMAHPLS
jgi:type VI secretion system secreted protein VgrG